MVILKTVSIGCSSVHQPVDHVLQNKRVSDIKLSSASLPCAVCQESSRRWWDSAAWVSRGRGPGLPTPRELWTRRHIGTASWAAATRTRLVSGKKASSQLDWDIHSLTVQYSFPEVLNRKRDRERSSYSQDISVNLKPVIKAVLSYRSSKQSWLIGHCPI